MSPCKYCIVRACCTQGCDPYKIFVKYASDLLTFISIVLAAIIIGGSMIYLTEFYPNQELAKNILQYTWIASIPFNITFRMLCLKKSAGPLMLEIIFGPFCTAIYLFLFLGTKIVKRV